MTRKLRSIASLLLLAVALAAGIYYAANHREIIDHLADTSWETTGAIFCLYALMFGVLLLIFVATMDICARKVPLAENAVINAYSLLINFFIPGQGGSAYRGLYLRQRHKLRLRDFAFASLLYYLFYALVSVLLLLASSRPWWETALAAMAVTGCGLLIIRRYSRRSPGGRLELKLGLRSAGFLLVATVLQAAVQILIYGIELASTSQAVSFSQIMTYTGAANLALFASLTPAAIGIRESFLLFTERLHHISSTNIIEANMIDRAVYIVFLLAILLIALGGRVINHQRLRRMSEPVGPTGSAEQ